MAHFSVRHANSVQRVFNVPPEKRVEIAARPHTGSTGSAGSFGVIQLVVNSVFTRN